MRGRKRGPLLPTWWRPVSQVAENKQLLPQYTKYDSATDSISFVVSGSDIGTTDIKVIYNERKQYVCS